MNDRPFFPHRSNQWTHQLASQWAVQIILLSLLVIGVTTLYPFRFVFTENSLLQDILANFNSRSSRLDVVANILLFAPLGFGLGSALAKRPFSWSTKLLTILLMSASLSLTIELLQVFLPGRQATPLDVVSNTVGGGVGFVCFLVGAPIVYGVLNAIATSTQRLLNQLNLKHLVTALVGYALLASTLVFFWQGFSLNGWDPDFPLAVGNNASVELKHWQRTLSTAWEGSVTNLVIRDRSLTKSEVEQVFAKPNGTPDSPGVLAAYSLVGQDGTQDQTGNAPALVWQGSSPSLAPHSRFSLSAQRWLKTESPVTQINQRIRDHSQFTLSATIAPASSSNELPLQPIIAIADSPRSGNVIVAQLRAGLSIAIRVSGPNQRSRMYQQVIPQIFSDTNPHRILITYSAFALRVYVDDATRMYLLDVTPNRYQLLFYLVILVPLAILISLITSRLQGNVPLYLLLLAGGTLLPALMLESFLANEGDRTIRLSNLLLGILIVGGTILVAKVGFVPRRQPHTLSSINQV